MKNAVTCILALLIALLGPTLCSASSTTITGRLKPGKASSVISTSTLGTGLPQAVYITLQITATPTTRQKALNHALITSDNLNFSHNIYFRLNYTHPFTYGKSFSACEYELLGQPHKVSFYLESLAGTKYDYSMALSHYNTNLAPKLDTWVEMAAPTEATYWMVPVEGDQDQAHTMTLEFRSAALFSPIQSVVVRNEHECKTKTGKLKRYLSDDGHRYALSIEDVGPAKWYITLEHDTSVTKAESLETKVSIKPTYKGMCKNGWCSKYT